jgi:hypothetical protein
MEENNKKKKVSHLQQMWDKSMAFIEGVGESLNFKSDDSGFIKLLKVLLRVIGILVLIAVSPLLIVTVFLIIAFAM